MTAIAIIGGGPAGYVAAITAARQDRQVTLIEEKSIGGVCLNEGCIPTKALLESAETFEKVKNAGLFGVRLPAGEAEIDWSGVQHRKQQIVQTLVQGVQYLMSKNQITVVNGKARFINDHQLAVDTESGTETIRADKVIIAAGSEPAALPFAPFDGEWVIHSGQAMSLASLPSELLIIGGGVIGCEFASVYSRMGARITIVEMADQLLPGEDADVAAVLEGKLAEDGVDIYTSASVKELRSLSQTAVIETKAGIKEVRADKVLVAVGRKPRVSTLQLENAGVAYSSHGIDVNERMETSVPHIYACGDIIGGIQLAHVAFHEGTVAALNACGESIEVNYHAVPRCIYTSPEIASVGLTEQQAREAYGDVRVGEFPFQANGKSLIAGQTAGKVKVLVEPQYNEVVGVSIVGAHATELIGQGTVMLQGEMTAESMEHFIAAHPTLSEAIHEALLNTVGEAVHV
ncbi:dihydrolipoyl dehydrogenase [Bacillus thermotolerans]|uniref:dihydrolipoyl dehydrogenase n=1 Tax=Bacillus thermotolerans TaxID=1221996 RepID=UPI0005893C12|nr:dihydrolipoyl dehydrogenase [Bacillus thermotolerans]KKB44048.1 Dihydrolipoamide dehydrogenase of acetoin dehydrogenase [Bacillus thermotolerans]